MRALSDLRIQAYQQLLSVAERRLQNIIGTTVIEQIPMLFMPPPNFSSDAPSLSLSPCSVGEREHHRSVRLGGKAGTVPKANGFGPPGGGGGRRSHHVGSAEGAGSPSRRFVPPGPAPGADGAGLQPAELPHLRLRFQQPPAEERHVLLEPWDANTVEICTEKMMQQFTLLCFVSEFIFNSHEHKVKS